MKSYGLIMFVEPPSYFWMIVCFSCCVIVSPFVFTWLPASHRCLFLVYAFISIVCQRYFVIIVASLLFHTEETGLSKSFDGHLGNIIKEIVMINPNYSMSLKINDVNFALRNVQNNDLLLVDHSKEVYDVFVLMFPENLPIFIQMDYALKLPWMVNSYYHEGMIVSSRNAEDLLHGRFERHSCHIS